MAEPGRRTRIATRLLIVYAVTFVVVLAFVGLLTELAARSALLDEVESGLSQQTMAVADFVPADSSDIQPWVDLVSDDIEARVTVVAPSGEVEGDSLGDRAVMENHLGRLEIDAALEGRVGTDRRLSASTGIRELYVAVLGQSGHVVRLSLPESSVSDRVSALRFDMMWVVGIAGVLGIVVVAAVGHRLARPLTGLAEAASAVASGDLTVEVPRSSVDELDRLGLAIASMASELGARLEEVEAERRTLGVVLDALPQGTLLVGAEEAVLYANRSFSDIFGPVPLSLSKLSPFRIQELVRQARREGPVDTDMEHGRPARVIHVLVSPLEHGRVLVVVGDVTEQRRIQDVRRDFVTNASHELKTPVASILASAETLQIAVERASDRVPQFARQIEAAARALAQLVTDLLDLSRLESRTMDQQDVDLTGVVEAEVDSILAMSTERGVTVISDVAPVTIRGSAADLALAVRNLMSNAVRFTEPGGEVSVALRQEESGRVVLTVADTGVGIPQRDLDRIFERFYRVDVARSRATGGTGLGLSMVRHVVEAHGGEIRVESELGAGSMFTIELPQE
ncbi:ATP-binding protein [soil metagenome]